MKKTERLGLTLTATEKSAVRQLAELEGGLSFAALMRRLIRKAAQAHGLWSAGHREVDSESQPGIESSVRSGGGRWMKENH